MPAAAAAGALPRPQSFPWTGDWGGAGILVYPTLPCEGSLWLKESRTYVAVQNSNAR